MKQVSHEMYVPSLKPAAIKPTICWVHHMSTIIMVHTSVNCSVIHAFLKLTTHPILDQYMLYMISMFYFCLQDIKDPADVYKPRNILSRGKNSFRLQAVNY